MGLKLNRSDETEESEESNESKESDESETYIYICLKFWRHPFLVIHITKILNRSLHTEPSCWQNFDTVGTKIVVKGLDYARFVTKELDYARFVLCSERVKKKNMLFHFNGTSEPNQSISTRNITKNDFSN